MRECAAGQRSLYKFRHELRGADLRQMRRPRDHLRFTRGRLYRKHPTRAAQHPLIGDVPFPEIISGSPQRNRETVGGDDGLEVRANVQVQRLEALVQALVIVKRQRAWMRIERKRAQRATQPGKLYVQLFGVPT